MASVHTPEEMVTCLAFGCEELVPQSSTKAEFCDECVGFACHFCGYGNTLGMDDIFCELCAARVGSLDDWHDDPNPAHGPNKAQIADGRERRNRVLSKEERLPSDRSQSLVSSRQGRSSSHRRSRSRTRSPGSRTRTRSSEYIRDYDRSYSHGSHSRRSRSRSPGRSRPTLNPATFRTTLPLLLSSLYLLHKPGPASPHELSE